MEIEKELISIIIPVYNAENFLQRCIESVLEQKYKNIEIILVDDGSNDDSVAICDGYVKKYKNIKCFHRENQGASASRNFGVSQASGEYIMFVDSDDYIESDMIQKMYDNLIKYNADMAMCNFCINDFKKSFSEKVIKLTQNEIFNFIQDLDNCGGFPWNKLFKKSVLLKIDGDLFDTDIFVAEDVLFLIKYISKIDTAVYIDEGLYRYSYRENSLSHSMNVERVDNANKAFNKIFEFYNQKKIPVIKFKIVYINIILGIKTSLKYNKDKSFNKNYDKILMKNFDDIKKQLGFKDYIKLYIKIYFYNSYFFLWKIKNYIFDKKHN